MNVVKRKWGCTLTSTHDGSGGAPINVCAPTPTTVGVEVSHTLINDIVPRPPWLAFWGVPPRLSTSHYSLHYLRHLWCLGTDDDMLDYF